MKKQELFDLCEERKIPVLKKSTIAELINALKTRKGNKSKSPSSKSSSSKSPSKSKSPSSKKSKSSKKEDYSKMKKQELLDLCEERDIDVLKKSTNQQLIDALITGKGNKTGSKEKKISSKELQDKSVEDLKEIAREKGIALSVNKKKKTHDDLVKEISEVIKKGSKKDSKISFSKKECNPDDYTLEVLKEKAAELGLPKTGTKKALCERINEEMNGKYKGKRGRAKKEPKKSFTYKKYESVDKFKPIGDHYYIKDNHDLKLGGKLVYLINNDNLSDVKKSLKKLKTQIDEINEYSSKDIAKVVPEIDYTAVNILTNKHTNYLLQSIPSRIIKEILVKLTGKKNILDSVLLEFIVPFIKKTKKEIVKFCRKEYDDEEYDPKCEDCELDEKEPPSVVEEEKFAYIEISPIVRSVIDRSYLHVINLFTKDEMKSAKKLIKDKDKDSNDDEERLNNMKKSDFKKFIDSELTLDDLFSKNGELKSFKPDTIHKYVKLAFRHKYKRHPVFSSIDADENTTITKILSMEKVATKKARQTFMKAAEEYHPESDVKVNKSALKTLFEKNPSWDPKKTAEKTYPTNEKELRKEINKWINKVTDSSLNEIFKDKLKSLKNINTLKDLLYSVKEHVERRDRIRNFIKKEKAEGPKKKKVTKKKAVKKKVKKEESDDEESDNEKKKKKDDEEDDKSESESESEEDNEKEDNEKEEESEKEEDNEKEEERDKDEESDKDKESDKEDNKNDDDEIPGDDVSL